MRKGRTQKEIKPMIKKDITMFAMKLMEEYPEIAGTSLEVYCKDELYRAMYEITTYGKVLTNKERYC